MKIGISTASFFGKVETEHCFDIIKELGLEFCEIFLTTYYEYEKSFVELLNKNRGDIKVHSVHSLNTQFEPQLFHDVERTRRDAEVVYKKVCEAGQAMGAGYYTFHGALKLKKTPLNISYDRLAKVVNNLIDIASQYNMRLSYENVHWTYYNFDGFFAELKKRCKNLYATLDVKQAMQSGVSYKAFIKDMGTSISTVHLCDLGSDGNLCLPGQGAFPFKELFKILKNNGIAPSYILEIYSKSYNDINDIKESLEFLKDCYGKA